MKQGGSPTIRILELTNATNKSEEVIRYILMDIEGTTTSIAFVQQILFPYAKNHLASYLRQHRKDPDLVQWITLCQDTVEQEEGYRPTINELTAILKRWIDEDRKHTGLKAIQGIIWKEGYESGAFTSDLYDDVLPCLQQWQERGLRLGIFSSGSVPAQRLLFAHTAKGDVTAYFSHFFDTRMGGKREKRAYEKIRVEVGLPSEEILFLSDVEAELNAAAETEFKTTQIVRAGTTAGERHVISRDFYGVTVEESKE